MMDIQLLSQIRDRLSVTVTGGASETTAASSLTQLQTIATNTAGKATEVTLAALLAKFTGTHTLTSTLETTSGTITAGAFSIGIYCNPSFVGTINGVARNADTYLSITADVGKTLPAVSYTVTAGNIIIDKLV